MKIEYQCESSNDFKEEHGYVRAFLYTDYHIRAHSHEYYEMNIVLRGRGTHQIENVSLEVSEGDVFVIPPYTGHAYYDTENLDVFHILLHKEFIADNRDEAITMPGFLQFVEIEPLLRQHFSKSMFLHLSPNDLLQLKYDLNFIKDDNFGSAEFIPMKKHTAWKIIYWMSFLLSKQIQNTKKNLLNKYELSIVSALEYIHQNYGEKITIESLCKMAFLSRSTFLRSFQNICGFTPIEYLNRYRCHKALEMLEKNTLPKTEIAQSCGFYDLSHMQRMLKKLT